MNQIYTKHLEALDLCLDGEIWKEISDTDGRYYISNYGRVLSLCFATPHILLPQPWGEYLCVEIKGKKRKIHRLVAQAFLENPDNKPIVHHKDSDKYNNKLMNLQYATYSENTKEYYKSKRQSDTE